MELQPITYDDACDFARKHDCGPIPAQGWKFGIAVNNGEKIVGIIAISRPAAHYKDDGWTLEVTQCCTDGTQGAASKLYAAAWQATRSMGFKQLMTYTPVTETRDFSAEPGTDITEEAKVSQEEKATLNSILVFPKQNREKLSDVEYLQVQLEAAKNVFDKLGHQDWVTDVSNALEKLEKDDFSFLENLWLKFARDVDQLILIAPQLHDPPLTEEQADALNGELAEVANATFVALDKVKDTRSSLMSGLL